MNEPKPIDEVIRRMDLALCAATGHRWKRRESGRPSGPGHPLTCVRCGYVVGYAGMDMPPKEVR